MNWITLRRSSLGLLFVICLGCGDPALKDNKIEQIEVQRSDGYWYCATVLERKDKKVKVHFNGYTDASNATVPESRTRKWSLNF